MALKWMRIREDGVAVVNVTECLHTQTGARIDSLYGALTSVQPATRVPREASSISCRHSLWLRRM